MHWVYLSVAILAEVVATSALKASDGMTQTWPTVLVVGGYSVSFYCLSLALKVVPVGVAYAIWSGVGIVLITAVAWWIYRQPLDFAAYLGMALIVLGVLVLRLFSHNGV